MKRSTLLLMLAMNVVWGGSYAATKDLMSHGPFFLITSLRYLIALAPLLIVAYRRTGLRMSAGDLLRTAIVGVATFTACPFLLYAGVSVSRAADAAVLTATEPLLVSLGAYFYLREKLDRRTIAALLTAFAGVLILSEFWNEQGAIDPAGPALIVVAVFFESLYSVIGKDLLRRHSPFKVIAVALACACAVNAGALTALGWWPRATGLTGADWLVLTLYLALLCTVVGYTFWFIALRETPAAKVTITIFTQPAVGIVIAWLWVNEQPTPVQLLGTGVILCGVALAVVRPRRSPREEPEQLVG